MKKLIILALIATGCGTPMVDSELTNWKKTYQQRLDRNITCTPQGDLSSMWLKSSNNFYSYRDKKIIIHLDSSTGVARRLIIGITKNNNTVYTRQEFCYYLRTDNETEPVNPQDHGQQILFDLELSAASNLFTPMEIFKYTITGSNVNLTRFDMNKDIDWSFCPTRKTPWGFCDPLRNGNEMFFPEDPDAAVQTQLKNEAILIRSEYNFTQIAQAEFNSTWDFTINSYVEEGTWEYIKNGGVWKYVVSSIPDEPFFIGRAWRNYLRRDRPYMPDTDSQTNRIICYNGRKNITLSDGSTGLVHGEVCYNNGDYTFTQ